MKNSNIVDYKVIGRRIAGLREQKGLSQGDLALGLGITKRYLQRIEKGETTLNTRILFNIAVFFKAKAEYIING